MDRQTRPATEVADGDGRPAACPVCGSRDVQVFWEAVDLPVFCNVLCATREEAKRMPRGDIRLAFCSGCGFVNNRSFDPDRLAYDVTYENSLHHSPRFQTYVEALADRLIEQYDLHDKDVLEIACGQGDFLKALCASGGNRGVGFDPSYVPRESTVPGTERVSFVQDYYSQRYADRKADFICCRHALEHFADPRSFLRQVRTNVGDGKAVVFFEVPNAMYTLREMGVWDLIYEHCNYFVSASLCECFRQAGFRVLDVREAFDGQFLTIEAEPVDSIDPSEHAVVADDVVRDVKAFADAYREKVAMWRERLDAMRRQDRRAVVWGSGSKGVTFLNVVQPEGAIGCVVDINPRKQGMFVAGAGQKIVAPDALSVYRPDTVIVMNPLYENEVSIALRRLGLDVEIVLA